MTFSVIIPTYNRSQLLFSCLRSLENQTFKDFEVLICDDGSTDDTGIMIAREKFDLDLKYFSIDNSGGPARPRNKAIENSKGDWFCFLDADDLWNNNKLEYCSQYLLNTDLIFHDMNLINGKSEKIGVFRGRNLWRKNELYDLLTNFNAIANSSVCLSRIAYNKIGKFNESEDLKFVEDFDYWLKAAMLGIRFRYLPIILGSYLIHDGNSSSNFIQQLTKIERLYIKYIENFEGSKKRDIFSSFNYIAGCLTEKSGNYSLAKKHFRHVLSNGKAKLKFKSIFKLMKYAFKHSQ